MQTSVLGRAVLGEEKPGGTSFLGTVSGSAWSSLSHPHLFLKFPEREIQAAFVTGDDSSKPGWSSKRAAQADQSWSAPLMSTWHHGDGPQAREIFQNPEVRAQPSLTEQQW